VEEDYNQEVKIVEREEVKWEPHPQLATTKAAYLLSLRDEKTEFIPNCVP
jgi:hypothetical protein